MSMFYFIGGSDDVQCPSCKHKYDIDWNTEYGDPMVGEHSGKCPNCNADIDFGCYIEYTQNSSQP